MKTKIAALALLLALVFPPGRVSAQAGQARKDTANMGAASTVKPGEGDLSLEDVLRRKASGLEVGMDEGGNITIRIRGAGTPMSGPNPLVLIDGMRVNNLSAELKSLDPLSIDKVRVLRDVASTSIYGTQGANGVILITTKKR
ncbi:MAG: TonB-dependent receptor plug domain-containing protein [Gemmatimonadetes bacterium]|nr:TonB-dependent receptor plug domain-containing protein [Gemmatimonadota bacterium]